MKARILATILVLMGMGLSEVTASAASATCLLRITCDSDSLPLTYDGVDALLRSSGVAADAVRAVPGIMEFWEDEPVSLEEFVFIRFKPAGMGKQPSGQLLLGQLTIDIEDYPVSGESVEQVLTGICRRLETLLREVGEQDRAQLEARLAAACEEVGQTQQRLAELRERRQQLCAAAGRTELSRKAIVEQVESWRSEQSEIQMNLAALKARQQTLSEQIAQASAQVRASVSDDSVAMELEKVVKLREREMDQAEALVEKGVSTEREAMQAAQSLAMARAQLAERRQHAAETAGGGLLAQLNQQLLTTSVESADLLGRAEYIAAQLKQIEQDNVLELADRYEGEVELQYDLARNTARDAAVHKERLEQQVRTFVPPTVTVLGGPAAE